MALVGFEKLESVTSGGSENASRAIQFVEFWEIDEVVTPAAEASVSLTKQIPAGGIPLWGTIKCTATGAIDTGTGIGVGTGSDVDEFFEGTFTSYDAVNDEASFTINAIIKAAATTVKVFSTDDAAAAAGTLTSGSWRVIIGGIRPRAIPDL